MSRFAVDSSVVEGAGAAVGASAATLASEVDAMLRHLLDLQATWQGQAAASFQDVVAGWRVTQQQVHASLESIGQTLGATGRTYEAAEADAVRVFSR